MRRSPQIHRFITAALAGVAAAAIGAAPASAQHKPRIATAARPAPQPPQMTVPYPGATVTVDPQLYQLWYLQNFPQQLPPGRRGPEHRQDRNFPGYYPPALSYPYAYYPYVSTGVTDANGRPLYIEEPAPAPAGGQGSYGQGGYGQAAYAQGGGYGLGTPDLSGTPYVADANGGMVVDFGSGVRTIPACAAQVAERTPNGQPRTIFYNPSSAGVILRAGQRGRVTGVPPAEAKACYTTDQYGRMAIDW